MGVRELTFWGVQGDPKINPDPVYWYSRTLCGFLGRNPEVDTETDQLIWLGTQADKEALEQRLPEDRRVILKAAEESDWNGKIAPLLMYIGLEPK